MSESRNLHSSSPLTIGRPVRRALIALVLAVGAFFISFEFGALYGLESAARNFEARVRPPAPLDSIVLVDITDPDYQHLFGGESPLNPAGVAQLLRAAASGGPRVIGVDLETSHPSFLALRALVDSLHAVGRPVVWAEDARPCAPPLTALDSVETIPRDCKSGAFVPLGVLGTSSSTISAPGILAGLVVTQLDPNGTVRHYRRMVPTPNGVRPSFASALGAAYAPSSQKTRQGDTTTRFITFHRRPIVAWRLDAAQLLALARGPDHGVAVLGNKLVLLGGTYRAARDAYLTPLGTLPGVYVQAQTVETELRGGGAGTPSRKRLAFLQFCAGTVVVFLLLTLGLKRAMAAVLVAIPVVSVLGSLAATGSTVAGLWYFVPLLLLLLLHQLYEKANHYRVLLLKEIYHEAGGAPHSESVRPAIDRIDGEFVAFGTFLGRHAGTRRRASTAATTTDDAGPATAGEARPPAASPTTST